MYKLIGLGIISTILLSSCFSQNKESTTLSGTTKKEPETIRFQTGTAIASGSEWDPTVMRTTQPVQDASGNTVTVTTNGPIIQSMTPEEQAKFQKEIRGK